MSKTPSQRQIFLDAHVTEKFGRDVAKWSQYKAEIIPVALRQNLGSLNPQEAFDFMAGGRGGGKLNWNLALGAGQDNPRIVNPPKAESPVWRDLKPYRGQYKTDAKNEKIYEWDKLHNDIEVYNHKGKHLGTMDPRTGEMIKAAEPGRNIEL